MVKSNEAAFSASIFAACPAARVARGLMQSDAATIGEISQSVAGSTAQTAAALGEAGAVVACLAGCHSPRRRYKAEPFIENRQRNHSVMFSGYGCGHG